MTTSKGEEVNIINIPMVFDVDFFLLTFAIVVSFQIAQVGNDKGAQEFLLQLDKDKAIGGLIDCTSSMYLRHLW